MTRPQDQQDVSASTVQESLNDTISGAKPLNELNERDPNNDWTRGEDSEEDDQHVFTSSKNQRGGRLFRSPQRGRGGNQVGTSRSYGYYGDSDLYENINISEASNSPIRPQKNSRARQSISIWEKYEPQEFIQRVESEKNKGKDKSSDQSSSSQNQSTSGGNGSKDSGEKDQATPPNNPNNSNNQGINWEEYGEDAEKRLLLDLMWEASRFFNREESPKESRLVDFPEFRGGNQNPIEWLESFDRACSANRVNEARKLILAGSYLKGTALTWYNQHHFGYWNNSQYATVSFTHQFQNEFCNPFKISQWKHQLRNRKQRPGETIEEYAAAIYELWKRIDPMSRRTELDCIHEFIEGLRPEFIIPVQSAMPASVADAVEKARAVETAFSIGMDLSAYSMLPGYINNMHGAPVPAKANMALYQSAYTAPQLDEVALEQKITKGIQEGILAAFAQQQ